MGKVSDLTIDDPDLRVRGLSIRYRIAVALLASTVVVLLVAGAVYHVRSQQSLVELIFDHLDTVATDRERSVRLVVNKYRELMALTASRTQLRLSLKAWLRERDAGRTPADSHLEKMQRILRDAGQSIPEFQSLAIYDLNGEFVISTARNPSEAPLKIETVRRIQEATRSVVELSGEAANRTLRLIDLLQLEQEKIGILSIQASADEFVQILDTSSGLGDSEESMLVARGDNGDLIPVVPPRLARNTNVALSPDPFAMPMGDLRMSGATRDYRDKEVFATAATLDVPNWGLVFKIDVDDALTPAHDQKLFLWKILIASLLAAIALAAVIAATITRPITAMTRSAKQIAVGNYTARMQTSRQDELGMLARAFNMMADKLITDNTILEQRVATQTVNLRQTNDRLTETNQRLEALSREDGLTGLANRRSFDERLQMEWRRCRRECKPIALLMVDIDHFKRFNDAIGHPAGDGCLIAVADILKASVNRSTDLAARYGGEEFVLLLPATTGENARVVADRVQQQLAEADIEHPDSPLGPHVTLSIGIASVEPSAENDDAAALVRAADNALYAAKRSGRAKSVFEALAVSKET